MADKPGAVEADSPPAEEPNLAVEQQDSLPETPTKDEAPPEVPQPGAEPPDEPKEPKAPKAKSDEAAADPVQQAIDRLGKAKPGPKPKDAAEKASPSTPDPKDGQSKTDKPVADNKPKDSKDDPFSDWSEDEQRHLRAKTRERFSKVFDRARAAEKELEKVKPVAELGSEFDQILKTYKVEEDVGMVEPGQLAGIIRSQASINRAIHALKAGRAPSEADAHVVSSVVRQMADVAKALKIPFGQAEVGPVKVPKFEGELSQDLKDLTEIYGIPEADVRDLAAMRALRTSEAKRAEAAKMAPPPQAQPVQPAAMPVSQPPAPAARADDTADRVYIARARSEIEASGVANADIQQHFAQQVLPRIYSKLAKEVPGVNPAEAFGALSPADKYQATVAAHKEWQAANKPKPSQNPGRPIRGGGAAPVRQSANSDPVASAIDELAFN